jgi:hypothetical protein
MENSQAWSAQRDTPGRSIDQDMHAEGVPGTGSTHPFRVRFSLECHQGLRSLHSLNPWLNPLHASGVLLQENS